MADLPTPNPVLPGIELLEQKISRLPIKKFKWDPTNSLGSYLEMSVDMVNLEEVMKLSKPFILDKNLRGVTGLFKQFWHQFEVAVKQLHTKTFKIDPFHSLNQKATLFVEQVYVELKDIQAVIGRFKPMWVQMEGAIAVVLSQLIRAKEQQLLGLDPGRSDPAIALPELVGKKDEIKQGREIRDRAVDYFQGFELYRDGSAFLRDRWDRTVAGVDSALWWIENEHRLMRGILLNLSQALDDLWFNQFKASAED